MELSLDAERAPRKPVRRGGSAPDCKKLVSVTEQSESWCNLLVPQVGVVSPYAVVEVDSGESSAPPRSRSFVVDKPADSRKQSRSPTADLVGKGKSGLPPKRRAPPPPSGREVKLDEGITVESFVYDACVSANCAVKLEKKVPPKKPPRTSSTFLEGTAAAVHTSAADYSVLSDCRSVPSRWVGGQLACLMADTVQRVYAKFLEQVLRPDSLWATGWQHLTLLSSSEVAYKGIQMSLQVYHIIHIDSSALNHYAY